MEQDFDRALGLAVRYLARRDRTEAELSAWLLARGVEEAVVTIVCERCRHKGWLSDERVAQRTVEVSAKRRRFGKLRVEQELERRQVSPEVQANSLEPLGPEAELERALEALASARPAKKTPISAARWLASRGFEEEIVVRAVEQVFGSLEPE